MSHSKELDSLHTQSLSGGVGSSFKCPFSAQDELNNELSVNTLHIMQHLPGHPRVNLRDHKEMMTFLESDLCSKDLEQLAPRLWWMSKQDSGNISPIHRQRVKKRQIIITEDPKLHLVWIDDRIFIKPLPDYLLSYTFWKHFLVDNSTSIPGERRRIDHITKSALGFLRTYFYLIRHQSDFRMAKDSSLCLVPAHVSWKQFCAFSAEFGCIKDCDVSGRYAYGEIRLTRLNLYAKVLLRKWYFQRVESQYRSYFAQFYGPFLFVFGILSVILSAMQVELGVEQVNSVMPLSAFRHASRGFSIACIISLICLSLGLFLLFAWKVGKEWHYALRDRFRRSEQRQRTTRSMA